MGPPRVDHEETDRHIGSDLRRLGYHARVLPSRGVASHGVATETTPLVTKSDSQRVSIDNDDLDLVALDKKLREIEEQVAGEDLEGPMRDIMRHELKALVRLSFPISCTLLLELGPQLVLVMMVSDVSGAASPQVISANQTYGNVLTGLGAAVATMCARSFGARQEEQLWLYAQAGLVACAWCVVPVALICLNGDGILRLLGQDPALTHISRVFMWINLATVPFQMLYTVARSALQAQNIATPVIWASVIAYAITLPLAYTIGYHSSLGYIGVSACFIVSNLVKVAVIVPVVVKTQLYVRSWPGWQWCHAARLARQLWPLTAGSVLMAMFLSLGFNLTGVLCGFLSDTSVTMAASRITSTFLNVVFVPLVGLWIAGTVRVGNALGAGRAKRARLASTVLISTMLAVACAGVCVAYTCVGAYARAYTSNDNARRLAVALTHHVLPLIPLTAGVYAAQAIFQACGVTWLCTQLNAFFFVLVAVPLGVVLALPVHGGVFGLWNGQVVGSLGFVLAAAVWLHRLDWNRLAHDARLNVRIHGGKEPHTEPSASE